MIIEIFYYNPEFRSSGLNTLVKASPFCMRLIFPLSCRIYVPSDYESEEIKCVHVFMLMHMYYNSSYLTGCSLLRLAAVVIIG